VVAPPIDGRYVIADCLRQYKAMATPEPRVAILKCPTPRSHGWNR
jgi:hypothetical protein